MKYKKLCFMWPTCSRPIKFYSSMRPVENYIYSFSILTARKASTGMSSWSTAGK